MIFLLLLSLITTTALNITISNCDYCSNQLCVFSYNSTNFTGKVKELFANFTTCNCSNTSCGIYCEKHYYSKDAIIDCIKSYSFFCFAANYVDASITGSMKIL